jgi:hypothetical protein
VIKQLGIGAAVRRCAQLAKGLRELASGKGLDRAANMMRTKGQTLLRDVFRTSTEPSGAAMVPLAYRDGRPLVLTGALSRGARVVVVGVGPFGITILFEVPDTSDVKAIWHQKGTVRGGPTTDPLRAQNRKSFRAGESERNHVPPRKMVPETQTEAAVWISAMDTVGQTELDRYLQKLAF